VVGEDCAAVACVERFVLARLGEAASVRLVVGAIFGPLAARSAPAGAVGSGQGGAAVGAGLGAGGVVDAVAAAACGVVGE